MRDLDSAVGRLDNIFMTLYVVIAALIIAVALVSSARFCRSEYSACEELLSSILSSIYPPLVLVLFAKSCPSLFCHLEPVFFVFEKWQFLGTQTSQPALNAGKRRVIFRLPLPQGVA